MIIFRINLKVILLLISINTSFESEKYSVNKPICDADDLNCIDDRSQRDAATLTIIDYGNQHVVCDDNHPFFCDILDPFDEGNLMKRSRFQFAGRMSPGVHVPNYKKYYSAEKNLDAKQKVDSSIQSDNFVCVEYGFFPDYNNHKMFYHCGHSLQGEGFLLRHTKCPIGLKFNAINKECIAYKSKANKNELMQPLFKKNKQITEFFHCDHNGLFPDKFNASMFWYCERNNKNGFTVTKRPCPDDELFDPVKKLCVISKGRMSLRKNYPKMKMIFQSMLKYLEIIAFHHRNEQN